MCCVSLWSSLRNLQAVCLRGFTSFQSPPATFVDFSTCLSFLPPSFSLIPVPQDTGQLFPSATPGSCQLGHSPAILHSGHPLRYSIPAQEDGGGTGLAMAAPLRRLFPETSCPSLPGDIPVFGISVWRNLELASLPARPLRSSLPSALSFPDWVLRFHI